MTNFEFTSGDVDGTRSKWRACLKESAVDADGHPVSWKRLAVVSCPGCGACFGIGGKGTPPISADGVTAYPAKCWNCGWTDDCNFLGWNEASIGEDFGKREAAALADVDAAKTAAVEEQVRAEQAAEFKSRVDEAIAIRKGGG